MLAGASRWVADHYSPTLLISRHATSFAKDDERFVAHDIDWNRPKFVEDMKEAMATVPPIGRALLWIHQPGRLIEQLIPLLPVGNTVLVLGSMDGQPKLQSDIQGIVTVRLGSMATNHGRRWLTHDEICAGAIKALQDRQSLVVGELNPI